MSSFIVKRQSTYFENSLEILEDTFENDWKV